jgi:hypothetical protein
MEDVLEVYKRPYDVRHPQVCLDEGSKQLLAEMREPVGMQPGKPKRTDDEYEREGICSIFLAVEPLTGQLVWQVTRRRTKVDFAQFVRDLVDIHYPLAEKVVLVMDNLNTHNLSSLYEAFEPAEAFRLAQKLEIHHTPKHGSWLNMAEIELSLLGRQCLNRRLSSIDLIRQEMTAWHQDRGQVTINWRFTSEDARIKLKRLYPVTK